MANSLASSGGAAAAFVFESTTFEVIDQQGQQWLKSGQLAQALGYADEKAVNRIYARHASEFTESMTGTVKLAEGVKLTSQVEMGQTVNLTVQGQLRETRIFSLRGAHLLAMFARTAIAALFRKWVLDILDAQIQQPRIPYSVNPTDTLSTAQAEQLRLIFKAKCDTLPQSEQAGFMTKGWSKLKSHFGCTYRKIQQREFSEAVSLATRHAAEWQAVELDAPDQQQTAINATDGPALKAARDVALRYFDDLRGAVKSGGGSASMGKIPTDALTGLVADALMRQRFMVTFDWCNGGMQVSPVPTDAIVCSAAQLPQMILQSDSPFSNDEVLAIARHANMRMMGAAGQIGKNEEVEQLRKTVRKLHPSYLLEIAQDAWMELGMRTALTNELGASA